MKTLRLIAVVVGLVMQIAVNAQKPVQIKGQISDSLNARRISSALVYATASGNKMITVTSDSLGRFQLALQSGLTYTLRVKKHGYAVWEKKILANQQLTSITVKLQAVNTQPVKIKTLEKRKEYDVHTYGGPVTSSPISPAVGDYSAEHLKHNYSVSYPSNFNTENYHHISENGYKDAKNEPLSTLSIDVDRASYANMRRFLQAGQLPPADAIRVEELINYFPYKYAAPKNNVPFSITTNLHPCPWNPEHQLIRVGIQGKEIDMQETQNNLVFLIDVSGSMQSEDKLPLLKAGLKLLVDNMKSNDRIALVAYAGAAGLILPPTDGKHREEILEALERLQSGGSTAGGAGIQLAYKVAREQFVKGGNNRIILATDGDFNVGVSSEGELQRLIEKERESGVYLTVLGFGTGNLKDATMEMLADKGNGNYAYIDNLMEAKKTLVNEMGGTLVTIASDVKIQVEFNPAKVKAYRLVGYENRLLNAEDFNDDKKDAGELGAGHTVTALYEIIPAGSTETVNGIDALKYQKTEPLTSATNEVMTIKFRYKLPGETNSKLLVNVLEDDFKNNVNLSADFKFATAVAEFGMLLRNSEYKGNATYKSIRQLALEGKGADENGYRAEFIRLIELAEMLDQRTGKLSD